MRCRRDSQLFIGIRFRWFWLVVAHRHPHAKWATDYHPITVANACTDDKFFQRQVGLLSESQGLVHSQGISAGDESREPPVVDVLEFGLKLQISARVEMGHQNKIYAEHAQQGRCCLPNVSNGDQSARKIKFYIICIRGERVLVLHSC